MVPVEPISLTIGAVALASLFSLCVECFDLIELARSLGPDFELLSIKLSIEKRRLMIWGEAVGILRPDLERDASLDQPETRQLIENVLNSIRKLFSDADSLSKTYGLETATSDDVAGSIEHRVVQGSVICAEAFQASEIVKFQAKFSTAASRRHGFRARARWAVRDSKKFSALVDNLKDLVDGLSQITVGPHTVRAKTELVREETSKIQDLQTLQTIEATCSDVDWRSCASVSGSLLGLDRDANSAIQGRIQAWLDESPDSSPGRPLTVETTGRRDNTIPAKRRVSRDMSIMRSEPDSSLLHLVRSNLPSKSIK
jgi:hypothetical protein